MQTGEVLRREVFNLLDAAKGGRLKKLKEVNKHEIVEGVTEDYMERRVAVTGLGVVSCIGNNIETFWDDVRKFTKNVYSDHSLSRWQILSEARFREIQ